jgi:hypothetical protein
MISYKLKLRAILYALSIAILLILTSSSVLAQHEGHDMSKMPGMGKPKPKAKPKPRPAAAATKKRQPTQVVAKPTEAKETEEAAASETVAATPAPTATPEPRASPVPADIHKHMNMPAETVAPSATPAPEKMDMPMPAQASPEPMTSQPQPAAAPHKHDMGNMNMSTTNENRQPGEMMGMNMPGMLMGSNGTITSPGGSGTSWQPASTPMHMLHWQKGDWMVMLHGEAKIGLNSQGAPRGVTKFESQNWLMAMASRRVGRGTLDLRSMFSFEPFTLSPGGSPELFQTGETYKGQPLRDKQHPHDLFMTLSASYTVPLGERASWFAYFGFPGEPALGPIAFMHRTSASENPSAPLAHHLQDSTHISYGVFTTGFTYRWFKLEGSVFNGREPDENRYDFEFNPWNSRSVRLSFAPNKNWAAQVSYGFLKNPEAAEPGDVRRTTASISYNKPLKRGNWATTLIWGRNRENHHNEPSTLNGYTAESTLQFLDRNYLYTRLELVDKNGLLDSADRLRLGITDAHPIFRIGAYTFGAARDIWETDKFTVALGGDVTFYSKPPVLDSVYGNNPTSYHFFVRFRLGRMSTGGNNRGSMTGMTHNSAVTGREAN